jgi:pyridoxal biosynthesis lyase PdxS
MARIDERTEAGRMYRGMKMQRKRKGNNGTGNAVEAVEMWDQ